MADPMEHLKEYHLASMTEVNLADQMVRLTEDPTEDRSASMTEENLADPMEYQMEDHLVQMKEPG